MDKVKAIEEVWEDHAYTVKSIARGQIHAHADKYETTAVVLANGVVQITYTVWNEDLQRELVRARRSEDNIRAWKEEVL